MRELFRALALPVYTPSFLVAAGQLGISVLLPLYVLSLDQPAAAAAAVVGITGVGSLLANLPAGLLVSRFGDKRVMQLALTVGGVAGLGMAAAASVAVLSVCAFLFGASGGAWLLARLSFMTEAAPPAQRGRAISLMGGVQRLGGFVGPVSATLIAETIGFSTAFLAAVLCIAAGLALVSRYTRNTTVSSGAAAPVLGAGADAVATVSAFTNAPAAGAAGRARAGVGAGTGRPDADVRPGFASQWHVLRTQRRLFMTAGLAVFAIALVRSAYALLIPLWGEHIGLGVAQIGLIFSVLSGIDMLLFYPVGLVMDRFGRKWVGVPCLLFIALSLVLLPLTDSFASLALVALLCGFGNGLGSGIVMTLGSDFAPRQRRGEFLGAWRSLADLGHIGAPFLTSLLSATAGLAGASMVAAGFGIVGALIMAFAVAEPLKRG